MSQYLRYAYLRAWYLVLVAVCLARHSLLYSSSSRSGIFCSKIWRVVSNLLFMLPNLMASKHYLSSLSVRTPSILPTRASLRAKNLSFLLCSHQFFQAKYLRSAISWRSCYTACLKAKKTLCLNVVSVIIWLSMSCFCCISCCLMAAIHLMNALRLNRRDLRQQILPMKSS